MAPGTSSKPTGSDDGDPALMRKGSVRAARERLRAAQHGQMLPREETLSVQQPPPRSSLLVSQFSPQSQQQHQRPPISTASPGSLGRSSESPGPQWPLPNDIIEEEPVPSVRRPAQQHQPKPNRGHPPQRPPRPAYVPDILDQTRQPPPQPRGNLQQPTQPTWPEEEFLEPDYPTAKPARPLTDSSQDSALAADYIPDFPVPNSGNMPRRPPTIGPPPSARRGPSSYYSQISYVSPIQEEAEHRASHGSFASSNVIPSGPHQFYYDEHSPSDEDAPHSPAVDGRHSRGEDHDESSGLVRQASLGKKAKPSLTTIKSGEDLKSHKGPKQSKPVNTKGAIAQAAIAVGTQGGAFAAGLGSQPDGPRPGSALSGGTGLLDPSSSSSESVDKVVKKQTVTSAPKKPMSPGPLSPPNRSRSPLVPGDLRKETGTPFDFGAKPPNQSTLSDRVGPRRPPRLNVDAVREAEIRGSLTSLPDLIRRATRLASNLDRGKTASRLGFEGWFDQAGDRGKGLDMEKDDRRSASLSDMLASFPPPGLATPTSPRTPTHGRSNRTLSGLSHHRFDSGYHLEKPPKARGRRVCGMRLGLFVVLLIILFCLVVAAIVIPIALIVLPGKNQAANSGFNSAFGVCQKQLTCANGGSVTVVADGSCGCICSNGFTGAACTQKSDVGCSTTAVPDVPNATVGTAIPRLLQAAQKNFSVPLEASKLLAVFAYSNTSCAAENALVSFNGLIARSLEPQEGSSTLPELALREAQGDAFITGGLVVAAPTLVPTGSSDNSPPAPTYTSPPISGTSTQIMDFARTAVLYILQESRNLDDAVLAQERLQAYFSRASSGSTKDSRVDAGNRNIVDLSGLRVKLGNGTVAGGSGNVTSSL
ncbi:hypothetical protein P152DRAFT_142628 [Eremomyces bilateralis CBS 781.70]|uniref:EGF-like domain-containing protein n=1 Tax=Eremomyces bilateralis CBS 781.70 TaxID=1392243 RepID=A0A6G1FW38_9PEZI|nr:uncharacterized protein P152DRAFT_142628 [Eremomyces bilateralis CBS 781.70]KAF1809891.1 hypothetical protein P152DRAFT_142628 [Eremomyces bilateralis CBS 781.70]